jgi:hypothetical protein
VCDAAYDDALCRRNSAASEISSIPIIMWLPTSRTLGDAGEATVPYSIVEYITGQVLNRRSLHFFSSHVKLSLGTCSYYYNIY